MPKYLSRWIVVVFLPLLLALYLSYPPFNVLLERTRTEKRVAHTAEEAREHNVSVGQFYVVKQEVLLRRFLPLSLAPRDESVRLVEMREDGTLVEERTVTARGRLKLGLDLAGGTELLYRLKPGEGERLAGAESNTIEILKRRIDPTNVKEFRIQLQEQDRILIQVPGATAAEVEQLKRRLAKMGKLEFKLAVPRSSDQARFIRWYEEAEQGRVPEGFVIMHLNDDPREPYYLVKKGEPEITGEYLGRVYPSRDQYGFPAVGFEFNAFGARRFEQITETNLNWGLAIILDGVLKSAPVIAEPIRGAGIIHGRFTQEEVQDMVNILQAGSLPMDIELLQENTVGPQLGRDSIRKGLQALVLAAIAVFGFMAIYYINCGWVADGALLLNVVFMCGVLSFLGAALTLPGMAGIVLTVGMAVDANVLIFERIREEQASGKPVRVALRNGYERAFVTILDSNLTTVLMGIVLYMVGTGPVKGFAVTLIFGIALSMFTALTITRLAFETLIESGRLEQFRMLALLSKPDIKFTSARRYAYVASLAVIIVGMVAFFARGSRLYDIDFTGGTLIRLSLAQPTSAAEVRARLARAGFSRAEVQGIRTGTATGDKLTDFSLRIKGARVEDLRKTVVPRVQERLKAAGIIKVGDVLSVSSDGRSLELKLREPVAELDVRRALADGGDIFHLPGFDDVLAPADQLTRHVSVRVYNVPQLLDPKELAVRMIRALAWAGLERQRYVITKCELEEQSSQGSSVILEMDKSLQWQVLAFELDRAGFPQVSVAAAEGSGSRFVIGGDRATLERLVKELPAGSELAGVPAVQINGATVTATLGKGFSEQDLRASFARHGFSDVQVVPLDVTATTYKLVISSEEIRQRMQELFADLAQRTVDVTFEQAHVPAESGRVTVVMKLSAPLTVGVIRHYLEAGGLGPYAEEILSGIDQYPADMQISQVSLALPADKAAQIQKRIQESFGEPRAVQSITSIGSAVAEEMQGRALLAVVLGSVIILLYVAVRFHAFRFGAAGVIALVHDLLVTVGLIAVADWAGIMGDVKINLPMLAAFLTVLGYSINDTIVVFDRMRENMAALGRRTVDAALIDMSVNQTLSRTVLTSATTLIVVVILYFMGGPVLQGLSLALIIGIVTGTYSTVFIASPLLLDWPALSRTVRAALRILLLPVRLPWKAIAWALGGRH